MEHVAAGQRRIDATGSVGGGAAVKAADRFQRRDGVTYAMIAGGAAGKAADTADRCHRRNGLAAGGSATGGALKNVARAAFLCWVPKVVLGFGHLDDDSPQSIGAPEVMTYVMPVLALTIVVTLSLLLGASVRLCCSDLEHADGTRGDQFDGTRGDQFRVRQPEMTGVGSCIGFTRSRVIALLLI